MTQRGLRPQPKGSNHGDHGGHGEGTDSPSKASDDANLVEGRSLFHPGSSFLSPWSPCPPWFTSSFLCHREHDAAKGRGPNLRRRTRFEWVVVRMKEGAGTNQICVISAIRGSKPFLLFAYHGGHGGHGEGTDFLSTTQDRVCESQKSFPSLFLFLSPWSPCPPWFKYLFF